MKKVCIMGLGYIGLPTAIVAAQHGFDVVGFDVDHNKVAAINNFDPTIQEPEIIDHLTTVLHQKTFRASTELVPADYFVIAVPTPFKEGKQADLSAVWKAADLLQNVIKKGDVIILESTIPVGTTEQFAAHLTEHTSLVAGVDFFIAHCPERVLPGKIFHELLHNARIIGGINTASTEQASRFYKKFVTGALHLTTAPSAEMVKLVENSSRDVAIAFANQVAAMAQAAGLDPYETIELANKHPRVSILQPGCGVGGHCIAIDPWFLIERFPDQTNLLQVARAINDRKPEEVITHLQEAIHQFLTTHNRKPTMIMLGLTYKAESDDLRESPALYIAQTIASEESVDLLICEPHIAADRVPELDEKFIEFSEGINQADIVVCLVRHTTFMNITAAQIQNKTVFDYCGLLHHARKQGGDANKLFWPANSISVQQLQETF